MLLGIDISTTGVKALLIGDSGEVIASATTPLELSTPKVLWSEQNPQDWWQGVASSVRQVLFESGASGCDVKAVGLTGQMHGLVLLDNNGEVLRPAILWNDQRTASQCAYITDIIGSQRLLQITGNNALTGFTAPKIIWVRDNEPEIYKNTAHVLLPKDFIRYRLTGEFAADKAGSAGTLLFDLNNRSWSAEILGGLEIPPEWMPETFEGPQITGVINSAAAQATGLKPDTPVVGGGGDQAAQAVGVGAVTEGVVAITMGTSGVVFASTDRPLVEPQGRLHAFCHAVPETWHFMGVMLSAAGSLRWYRDTFSPDSSYEELLAPAEAVSTASEGLFFMPYLTGERTPYPDPLARGAFVGLTLRHSMAHLTRAVLEGVAFGLRDSMELIQGAGLGEISQVRVSGGGARSSFWLQILSDVIDTELVTVNSTEGAAYGAALLAGAGCGVWDSVLEACRATIQPVDYIRPVSEIVGIYQEAYAVYRGLYPALKQSFTAAANFHP